MHRNTPAIFLAMAGILGIGPGIVGAPMPRVSQLPWDHNRGSRRRARFSKGKTRPTWVGAYERRYESPALETRRQRRHNARLEKLSRGRA